MASTGYLLGGESGAMLGALNGFSNLNNTGAQLAQSSLNSLKNLPDYTYGTSEINYL